MTADPGASLPDVPPDEAPARRLPHRRVEGCAERGAGRGPGSDVDAGLGEGAGHPSDGIAESLAEHLSEELAAELAEQPAPVEHPDHDGSAELLVITGMSGAGRSTAAHVLEDLGWYVVDNLPPQLIASLTDLSAAATPAVPRIAVVVDVRVRSFFVELRAALDDADRHDMSTRLLFLDATDDALVRRFESVRRPHPLQGDGTLLDGIAREREQLRDLRGGADTVIDTSRLNVHELSQAIARAFGDAGAAALRLSIMSFGFKYGLPLDADHVADVRFLPNPYWVPGLRHKSGLDGPVSRYVLAQDGAAEFLDRYAAALQPVLAGYLRENKRYVTVAIGCTGGRHRSVAVVEELAARLDAPGLSTSTIHRDLGRE